MGRRSINNVEFMFKRSFDQYFHENIESGKIINFFLKSFLQQLTSDFTNIHLI